MEFNNNNNNSDNVFMHWLGLLAKISNKCESSLTKEQLS